MGEHKAAVSFGHWSRTLQKASLPGMVIPLCRQSRGLPRVYCAVCARLSLLLVPLPPSPSSLFCVKLLFCVWVCSDPSEPSGSAAGVALWRRVRAGYQSWCATRGRGTHFARRGQSSRDQVSPSSEHPRHAEAAAFPGGRFFRVCPTEIRMHTGV